jgi:hypothetical protein
MFLDESNANNMQEQHFPMEVGQGYQPIGEKTDVWEM